jgi:L-lactate dehydrogenase complex protein LldG
MKDTITAKERMLKNIRKSLLEKRDNPYPKLEDSSLYPENIDELEICFAEELSAVNGHFIFCENGIEFIENMLALADQYKWRKIYCWEPELQELLSEYEFPFYQTDNQFENAEVGITSCEALIARNGSVMLSNANAAGRKLSIFPNQHIVVARTGQLVLDINDAFKLIKEKYKDNLPSMISTVTGPACSYAIENDPALALAQGSKDLFVFMVDDFS